MRGQILERELIYAWIAGSIGRMLKKDYLLFKLNTREETISHRLATYLEKNLEMTGKIGFNLGVSFGKFSVDCEYDRYGGGEKETESELKSLALDRYKTGVSCRDEKIVRPDIVVHERGTESANFLVAELKKASGSKKEYARDKVEVFVKSNKYHYDYGLYLEFKTGQQIKENKIIKQAIVSNRFNMPCVNLTQRIIGALEDQQEEIV